MYKDKSIIITKVIDGELLNLCPTNLKTLECNELPKRLKANC